MADPHIEVGLNTDFFDIRDQIPADCTVIYSGPIDRFFDYRHGVLGWRTIRFEQERVSVGDFQGTTVVNYADPEVPYTRIHEFRHYHPERSSYPADKSIIYREFSLSCGRDDDPYYPVNTERDREMYELYRRDGELLENVVFGARLGTYRYLDMDKVIDQALEMYETRIKRDSGK